MKSRRLRNSEAHSGGEANKKENSGSGIRLNKFIAAAGVCSRREADKLIEMGKISVNGNVITELGAKVSTDDQVTYNGKLLKPENNVYVLLNKPKDFVTTLSDPHAKRTVMELVKNSGEERIFPVGRLDRNTTGILLLTNDGELADKLTHPSYNKMKIYHVFLDKELSKNHFNEILNGFELEDGFIKADALNYVDESEKNHVGIEIHSGRNRIVRRIFAHLGYKVARLDRVYFAGLTKKGLQRGHWRHLTPAEISMLKKGSYK